MLATLAKLAEKLKQQKYEATKIRRKNERALKEAMSLGRRSSSGLRSLEKHLEHNREELTDINAEFNQILARKESLERLAKSAQERLIRENEAKDQSEIDLANADTDEAKSDAQYRLDIANEKIRELESEIQIREKAVKKVDQEIIDYKKSQSTTSQKIHKQAKSKPVLVTQLKESKIDSELFKRKLETSSKREENASKALSKVTAKLEVLMAKKRRAAAKKAAAKRKALAKKKAAKRRAAAKKAAAKRKAKKFKKASKKSKKKSRR
ncbi:MAG: ATPase V [Candidatus Nitrosotenuis sp.]